MLAERGEVSVRVCECWLRDGLQSWPAQVPTAVKLKVIHDLAAAGIQEVDATSFVPSAMSNQFDDAAEVLAYLAGMATVTVRVLAVNPKSMERLARVQDSTGGIHICGMPISASESHNIANLRRNHLSQKQNIETMVNMCRALKIEPLLGIATAFGCPLEGAIDEDRVMEFAHWGYEQLGIRRLMLGDTTGMADPVHAYQLHSRLIEELPGVIAIAHFHDTRANGIANTVAAIAAGVRTVDSSLGGLGGEPRAIQQGHSGASGNVCTEDLIALLNRMGLVTGVDTEDLISIGQAVESALGLRLRSAVVSAGPACPRDAKRTAP